LNLVEGATHHLSASRLSEATKLQESLLSVIQRAERAYQDYHQAEQHNVTMVEYINNLMAATAPASPDASASAAKGAASSTK
jgi:hypothetical protein